MDGAREDVLAYLAVFREHWPQIAGTNALEWLNGETKRPLGCGGDLPEQLAIIRLVAALMLEQNNDLGRHWLYMSLESLPP